MQKAHLLYQTAVLKIEMPSRHGKLLFITFTRFNLINSFASLWTIPRSLDNPWLFLLHHNLCKDEKLLHTFILQKESVTITRKRKLATMWNKSAERSIFHDVYESSTAPSIYHYSFGGQMFENKIIAIVLNVKQNQKKIIMSGMTSWKIHFFRDILRKMKPFHRCRHLSLTGNKAHFTLTFDIDHKTSFLSQPESRKKHSLSCATRN